MPNRTVREAAISSERVNALGWQAEVFWRRLINRVDDYGRFTAHPELLRSSIFPLQLSKVSGADIGKLLLECENAGLVSTYTAGDGKQYLAMHQFEQGRAEKSKYPDPPPDVCKRLQAVANNCKQPQADVPDYTINDLTIIDQAINRLSNRSKRRADGDGDESESAFVVAAEQLFGGAEMAKNGGGWRKRYRENKAKAWRVLRELRSTIRERPKEIKSSPAQFAQDLWRRFA